MKVIPLFQKEIIHILSYFFASFVNAMRFIIIIIIQDNCLATSFVILYVVAVGSKSYTNNTKYQSTTAKQAEQTTLVAPHPCF